MWVQQAVKSGQPMLRYPVDPITFWCLVPMNIVKEGDPNALDSDGTFFLAAGRYLVFGAVGGFPGSATQGSIAIVNKASAAATTFPLVGQVTETLGSRFGDNVYFGFLEVPNVTFGGSSVGIYQYIKPAPAGGPNLFTNVGLPEVYASILFLPQACPCPPLQLSLSQTGTNPQNLNAQTWSAVSINSLSTSLFEVPSPQTSSSFFLQAGTYFVVGSVARPSTQGGNSGVSCLATTDPTTLVFDVNNVLLVSAGGSTGDMEFQGFVVIPPCGATVAVFAYVDLASQLGFTNANGITQAYANLNLTLVANPSGSSSNLYCCPPLVPYPQNFVVTETLPSGTFPEAVSVTGPTTALRRVLLNSVQGLPSSSLLSNGAFLIPRGSWVVQGLTSGALSRAAVLGILASVNPEQGVYQDGSTLLQGTNSFGGNIHFDGLLSLEQDTWVALFTSYPNLANPFGFPLSAGVPEIYTRLLFWAAPGPVQLCQQPPLFC